VINACEPELVLLQEATRPEVVRMLAAACGMKSWGASFGDSTAFLSRSDVGRHEWGRVTVARRRYLEIELEDGKARVFNIHLSAIHSNLTERRRTFEIGGLLRAIAPHREGFHLLAGDFNTVAVDDPFDARRLPLRLRALLWASGPMRWTAHAAMLAGGYADGYRLLHKDGGHTFPTWAPHVRLDYLFVPSRAASTVERCEVIRDAPGVKEASDHFPLLAEIAIPPG
jgi:endonuclease/exonuclease/phosphatase family metal-dependent hydrolase